MNKPSFVQVAFLIPNKSWLGTVVSPAEILHGVSQQPALTSSSVYQGFETYFVRTSEEDISGFSGLAIETLFVGDERLRCKKFDVVIVPSVWDLSMNNIAGSHIALKWLKQQHDQGAIIAGLVMGVFYLAEAGLLDGREATVHDASLNIFKQRYPKARTRPELQMIEAERVITTSTTPATFDLALMIIKRFLGDRSAEHAAHYFRIREKDAALPSFLEPSCNDTLVDAARDYLRLHHTETISLNALAIELNVSPRTLSRRFSQATGISPIQYLVRHRLEVARDLLRATDQQVQYIAYKTGFGSTTVFCRQFKHVYKETPGQFRAGL